VVISKWGTGIDSIDQEAAASRGVRVCNTPDAFTDPVADSALGLALALGRNIARSNALMQDGRWEKLQGFSLSECTFGVVGVGRIGEAVLHRAGAFGAELLGTDVREISPSTVARLRVEMTDLDDLLARADVVSLHCDLNPTSHHLVGERELGLMKPGAVLINTARGPIIDEPALVRALDEGRIRGAGLDVFEEEPLPATSGLRGRPDVLLSAHNTNSSPRAARRVHENTLRQLYEALEDAE
jgi:phosphoglycerate dehydrogenase-like enzyme